MLPHLIFLSLLGVAPPLWLIRESLAHHRQLRLFCVSCPPTQYWPYHPGGASAGSHWRAGKRAARWHVADAGHRRYSPGPGRRGLPLWRGLCDAGVVAPKPAAPSAVENAVSHRYVVRICPSGLAFSVCLPVLAVEPAVEHADDIELLLQLLRGGRGGRSRNVCSARATIAKPCCYLVKGERFRLFRTIAVDINEYPCAKSASTILPFLLPSMPEA